MDGLRKLENVQKIIQMMGSHGIISSSSNTHNASSLRFLADVVLLLVNFRSFLILELVLGSIFSICVFIFCMGMEVV